MPVYLQEMVVTSPSKLLFVIALQLLHTVSRSDVIYVWVWKFQMLVVGRTTKQMKHDCSWNIPSVEMSPLGLRLCVDTSASGQHIWMFHLKPCIICIMCIMAHCWADWASVSVVAPTCHDSRSTSLLAAVAHRRSFFYTLLQGDHVSGNPQKVEELCCVPLKSWTRDHEITTSMERSISVLEKWWKVVEMSRKVVGKWY